MSEPETGWEQFDKRYASNWTALFLILLMVFMAMSDSCSAVAMRERIEKLEAR